MTLWHVITQHPGALRGPYTVAVTLLDLVLFLLLQIAVSRARIQFKVQAPSTEGPPEFRRAYRMHVNMMEQLVLHLPLLWLAMPVLGDMRAAMLGLLWLGGRVLYVNDYRRDPKTRAGGFIIGLVINAILIVIVAAGIVRAV